MDPFYDRIAILYNQNRHKDAQELLEVRLAQNPDDFIGQYYLALVFLQSGEKEKSRKIVEKLLEEEPTSLPILQLATSMDLADDKYHAAEEKAELLQQHYPEQSISHFMMARVKLAQNNYDQVIRHTDKALELDPENLDAYNTKIIAENILGKKDAALTVEKALQLDPESPSSIANHGAQLLGQGKVKEALERLHYALSLDPTNQLARYYMQEALKNKFWPYRFLYAYKQFVAKLSAKGSWTFIIGIYIVYRILIAVSQSDSVFAPIAEPLVYLLFGLFILSWVMDPLINLYLLTNRYGTLLLDNKDKTMAQYTGGSLMLSLFCLAGYLYSNSEMMMNLGLAFFVFMIPLGTFLTPTKEENRNKLTYFTIGIIGLGLLGIFTNNSILITIAFIGVFLYQWVVNGILIKENARVFD
jgi:tetratricopeptide (TPR) repeat protein